MEAQVEARPRGQEESCMEFQVIKPRPSEKPFVVMTVTGPENALCMRLNKRTVRDVIRKLELMVGEL